MQSKFMRSLALAPLVFCGAAAAHPGHNGGALAGLMHPLLGADHLLAMLAVGVWAAQMGGRARWLLPTSFLALLALGGVLGMEGVALPMIEGGIATSVLLLGLLIAFAVKLPATLGAAMVGMFAVFHGVAHGSEMPALSTAWQYGLGFVASSAALHALGVRLGDATRQHGQWLRAAGAAITLCGVWMAV
ncbi:MAG TPA: urease accessory protein UreJ [Janthinobacterium sp.]|nr:urease accessory protein UreJ [Janthinobacterium sp.]